MPTVRAPAARRRCRISFTLPAPLSRRATSCRGNGLPPSASTHSACLLWRRAQRLLPPATYYLPHIHYCPRVGTEAATEGGQWDGRSACYHSRLVSPALGTTACLHTPTHLTPTCRLDGAAGGGARGGAAALPWLAVGAPPPPLLYLHLLASHSLPAGQGMPVRAGRRSSPLLSYASPPPLQPLAPDATSPHLISTTTSSSHERHVLYLPSPPVYHNLPPSLWTDRDGGLLPGGGRASFRRAANCLPPLSWRASAADAQW